MMVASSVVRLSATGEVSIETYIDGDGPDVVTLPSYVRDGGDDFDPLTAALASADYRVTRTVALILYTHARWASHKRMRARLGA